MPVPWQLEVWNRVSFVCPHGYRSHGSAAGAAFLQHGENREAVFDLSYDKFDGDDRNAMWRQAVWFRKVCLRETRGREEPT